jgi:hypothetical protein
MLGLALNIWLGCLGWSHGLLTDSLLLENENNVLMENGSLIVLE